MLSYIADVAVNGYHWLSAPEMVRGLSLAESRPGPLIMVTEHVGFAAAWKTAPPDVARCVYATLGALLTVCATSLPMFLFISSARRTSSSSRPSDGSRRADRRGRGRRGAVIANLVVFFGLRALFPRRAASTPSRPSWRQGCLDDALDEAACSPSASASATF